MDNKTHETHINSSTTNTHKHTNTKTHPGCKHLNNIGAAVLIKKGSLLLLSLSAVEPTLYSDQQ